MGIMTAKTRSLRSDDLGQADGAADIREGARRQPALVGPARPYNDNTRADDVRTNDPHTNHTWESRADRPAAVPFAKSGETSYRAAPEAVGSSPSALRRGPLVTRWIGFAAKRRQAQARADRMSDRLSGTDSDAFRS